MQYDIIFSGSTNDHALRFQAYQNQTFTEGKVDIKPLGGGATFANRQAEGDFKALAYTITATPDAVIELISQYRTGGSRNYGGFSNADSDRILDKAVGELNRDTRFALMDEYQQKWGLKRDYPMVAPSYASARSELAKSMGLGRKGAARSGRQPHPDREDGTQPEAA